MTKGKQNSPPEPKWLPGLRKSIAEHEQYDADGHVCYTNVKLIIEKVFEALHIPTHVGYTGCIDKKELVIAALVAGGMDPSAIERVAVITPTFNEPFSHNMSRYRKAGVIPPHVNHVTVDDAFSSSANVDKGYDALFTPSMLSQGISFKDLFFYVDGVTFHFPHDAPDEVQMIYPDKNNKFSVETVHLKPMPTQGHLGIGIRSTLAKSLSSDWSIADSSSGTIHSLQEFRELCKPSDGVLLHCPLSGDKLSICKDWLTDSQQDWYTQKTSDYAHLDEEQKDGIFLGNFILALLLIQVNGHALQQGEEIKLQESLLLLTQTTKRTGTHYGKKGNGEKNGQTA